jgi:cyclohexyl-isocyanide hydratase
MPTTTFEACPALDILVVPGGFGVEQAMLDAETVSFVCRAGEAARYVTSVCTGAFLLGMAGLLEGKRATTHWAYRDALRDVGATPVDARVVRDGNVITGGGVTAGIDFAFVVAAELAGEEVAQRIQLALEYDPHPPFAAGNPTTAPDAVVTRVRDRYAPRIAEFEAKLREHRRR